MLPDNIGQAVQTQLADATICEIFTWTFLISQTIVIASIYQREMAVNSAPPNI